MCAYILYKVYVQDICIRYMYMLAYISIFKYKYNIQFGNA